MQYFNKTGTVLFIIMCSTAICGIFYYPKNHSIPTVGWRTADSVEEPFRPGIITNGQPPADFEVTLVEPAFHSRIKAKPAERFKFLVKTRPVDTDKPNSDIPPTYLDIKILHDKNAMSVVSLRPFAMDGRSFLYSGEVEAPQKAGDYDVTIEVRHVIFDGSGGGGLKHIDPVSKTIKGATLHVGK